MNLSVILCTYNRAKLLDRALHSLEQVRPPAGLSWELVLVDNNSSDDTKAVVDAGIGRGILPCRYVFEPRQGVSTARNTGIAQAKADILVFTDDDVAFDPGWLRAVLKAFDEPKCLGIAGQIVPAWSTPRPSWYAETGPYALMTAIIRYQFGDQLKPVEQPPWGANMAYRRDAFTRYGSFDPRLGPMGSTLMRGEDVILGRRMLAAGELLLYVPDAIVYHPVEPERLRKKYFQSYYYQHGRMEIRIHPVPAGAVRWLGVPRYLLRPLLTNVARWLTAIRPNRRFYYRLECALMLGKIVEAYGLPQRQRERNDR
jgi:glucosyl-dolichyl phosphate glucuronosyltransferase